jgi:hypothetical protein
MYGVSDDQVNQRIADVLPDAKNTSLWEDGAFDWEAWDTLMAARIEVAREEEEVSAGEWGVAHVKALRRALGKFRTMGDGGLTVSVVEGDPHSFSRERELVDDFRYASKMLPADWIAQSNEKGLLHVALLPEGQEHPYHESEGDDSFIYCEPGSLTVPLHELAHRVQKTSPEVFAHEATFFRARDKAGTGFIDPLMGQMYFVEHEGKAGIVAGEILPRGVVEVWFPGHSGNGNIFEDDPEYAHFILGLLARG